jgi:hypothetical protein
VVTHIGVIQADRAPPALAPSARFITAPQAQVVTRLVESPLPSLADTSGESDRTASTARRAVPPADSSPIAPPSAPPSAPQTSSSAGSGGHGLTSLLLLAPLGPAALIGSRRISAPVLILRQRHDRPPVSPG